MTCYETDTQELDTGTMRRTTHSNCSYSPRLLPLVYHTRGWGGQLSSLQFSISYMGVGWGGVGQVPCSLVYHIRGWGGVGRFLVHCSLV